MVQFILEVVKLLIHVYTYSANVTAGYLTLISGENNLDCILIGTTFMRSDNIVFAQSQYGRVLSLGGNSAKVYFEGASLTGDVYIIKRFSFIGNFNKDVLSAFVSSNPDMRVEIRNEYGVLIWDNGLPLPDGTYPPDAKNRAGLAGLHAAPIASNNEFADLSGLDPNKEVEMIYGERGEGMQYALERNEDNGL